MKAFLVVVLVVFACHGAVVDFQSLETADAALHFVGTSYTEDGFLLEQVGFQGYPLAFFGTLDSRYPGSTALFNDTGGGLTRLTEVGGGLFSLDSIDLALLNAPGSVSVHFIGTHSDLSTIEQTFIATTFGSLTTFAFSAGWTDLVQVDWTQDSPYHQFDNIVTNGGGVGGVPEPAALALVGSGLVALGLVSRRRKSGR